MDSGRCLFFRCQCGAALAFSAGTVDFIHSLKRFLQTWLVTTFGMMIASYVVSGIHAESTQTLLVASFILGLLNAFIRPALMILTLPIMILSLGLFTFILNALLIYFTGWVVEGFHVASFMAAFKGGLVISFITLVSSAFLPKKNTGTTRSNSSRTPPPAPDSRGPVIDV